MRKPRLPKDVTTLAEYADWLQLIRAMLDEYEVKACSRRPRDLFELRHLDRLYGFMRRSDPHWRSIVARRETALSN